MSSPLPPQPGETPEQRQARFDGAYRKQAEVDAEMRAELDAREEAARMRLAPPSPFAITPVVADAPGMAPGYADYLQRLAVSRASTPVMPEVEVRGVRPEMLAPPKPMPLYVDPEPPMPVPSASDYIYNMIGNGAPPVALPGGSGYDERGNMLKKPSRPTMVDMLRGSMLPQMQPTMPSTAPGLLAPPMQPSMDTQPTINREFNMLRERYGDEGLQSAVREYYRGGPVMRYR